jgi:hypothetical protein
MYKPKKRANTPPYNSTKEASLGEQLANTSSPRLSPHPRLSFDFVEQGCHRRLSVVEDSCVAMLSDSPRHEQDEQRGSIAKHARGGTYKPWPYKFLSNISERSFYGFYCPKGQILSSV